MPELGEKIDGFAATHISANPGRSAKPSHDPNARYLQEGCACGQGLQSAHVLQISDPRKFLSWAKLQLN